MVYLWYKRSDPIKVGILYANHGPFAKQEKPIIDMILYTIAELNAKGGVNNRRLIPIFARSTLKTDQDFARIAKRMVIHDRVDFLIGCRDFISRRAVQPIVEKQKALLLYPVSWEGLENSPNILFGGTALNQQIIPILTWAYSNFGKKMMLIAEDTAFNHIIEYIMKHYTKALAINTFSSNFIKNNTNQDTLVSAIKNDPPDVIINIVSDENNNLFFKTLYNKGLTPRDIGIISIVFSDNDRELQQEQFFDSYVTKSYFQSLSTVKNKEFLKNFHAQHPGVTVTTTMQTAYTCIHLWAQAAHTAKSTHLTLIEKVLGKQTFNAPEGPVAIDAQTGCCWHTIRLNKIINETSSTAVWDSKTPIQPLPYPPFTTKDGWENFLKTLSTQWSIA